MIAILDAFTCSRFEEWLRPGPSIMFGKPVIAGARAGTLQQDTLYVWHVSMSGRVPPERSADSPMKPNHARQLANPVAGWPFCLGGRGGA